MDLDTDETIEQLINAQLPELVEQTKQYLLSIDGMQDIPLEELEQTELALAAAAVFLAAST